MASNDPLEVYLNDHLAGSAAGIELAGKLRDNHQGTEFGEIMTALHRDISQDRDALEELMRHLEVERHQVKEAAGRVTGDERLEAEGRADKTKANLKQAGEKVKDAFRGR